MTTEITRLLHLGGERDLCKLKMRSLKLTCQPARISLSEAIVFLNSFSEQGHSKAPFKRRVTFFSIIPPFADPKL